MTNRKKLHLCGISAGTAFVVGGLLLSRWPQLFHGIASLDVAQSFFYPLPEPGIIPGLCLIVLGILLIALSTGSFSQNLMRSPLILPPSLRDSQPQSKSPFHARMLYPSCISYLVFITLLTLNGYSHELLLLFALSLGGFATSIRNGYLQNARDCEDLCDRLDILIVVAVVLLSFPLLSQDLTSWYFSNVGDEAAFYGKAKDIVTNPVFNFFGYSGVYQKFPLGDSYYTALFFWIFGVSIWSWKLSCVVVHILTAVLVYFLGKFLFDRTAGIVSSLLVAFSHYFIAFDHIGYNNTNLCFTSVLSVLLLTLACRTGSRRFYFLTGCISGLLSYSIWGGLLTLPVVAIALLLIWSTQRDRTFLIVCVCYSLSGFLLSALPGLISNTIEDVRSISLGLNHGANPLTDQSLDYWSAMLTSATAFFVNRWWGDHYVFGPFLDPVTGLLALIGIGTLLGGTRSWQIKIVLTWLVIGFFGVILLSRANNPYVTRLLYLLPPLGIAAGYAFSIFIDYLESARLKHALTALTLGVSVVLNFQQLYLGTPLDLPVYMPRLTVKETLNAPAGQVVYISPGSEIDENMYKLLVMVAPPDLRITVTTEQKLTDALQDGSVVNLMLNNAKIIAPAGLLPFVYKLKSAGMASSVTRVHAFPYGDDLITANHPSAQSSLVSPTYFPGIVRELIGMF